MSVGVRARDNGAGRPAARPAIAAVLFDLDHTLISRGAVYRGRLAAFLYTAVVQRVTAQKPEGAPSPSSPLRVPGAVARLLYERSARGVVLDPEARRLLDALDHHGLPYGIVTNGRARKRHTIRLLGLEQRTPHILISGEQGRRKPDAVLFQRAAAELGVDPARILFVGDQRREDMHGARDSGMQTAWLRRTSRPGRSRAAGDADIILSALPDLLPALGLPRA